MLCPELRQGFLSIKMSLVFLALAVFLLASGCGDDTNSEGSGSTEIAVETGSLPKAQFIKRADTICGEAVRKVRFALRVFLVKTLKAKSTVAERPAELSQVINMVLAPTFEKQIDEVSSLGAPAGDEEKVSAILEAIQQSLVKAKEDPLEFIENANSFAKPTQLGEAYGFTWCGVL